MEKTQAPKRQRKNIKTKPKPQNVENDTTKKTLPPFNSTHEDVSPASSSDIISDIDYSFYPSDAESLSTKFRYTLA